MRTFLAVAATLALALPLFGKDAEHAFQSSVPRGAVRRVVIDVPAGAFTIRNGAADRLAVSGVASRDYDGQREGIRAQEIVNDTSVEIYVNGAEAIVRRKFGRKADSWRAQKFTGIDLRLDLPPGVDVEFETSAGEIKMDGHFGDVRIDLRAGEIDLRVPKATVRELNASCRVGEVRANLGREIVTREGIFPGRTHYFNPEGKSRINVHTTAGEIRITLVP